MALPRISRRLAYALAAVAATAAVAAAGCFRVRPGEVFMARAGDGGGAGLYAPGWHWRWPWARAGVRLPTTPLSLALPISAPSREEAVALTLSGRFALAPGREGDWVRAAGWPRFADGLQRLVERRLQERTGGASGEAVLALAGGGGLTATAAAALAEAGVEAEELAVRPDRQANRALVERVRQRLRGLARTGGRKVLLVGWDGADWLMIRPLLEAGRLPHLRRLMDRGAHGELLSERPLLSPLLWTTVATGKPVTEHGVADFLVKDEAGNLAPIGSSARRVHALWTILPAFTLRNDVVAWWATWPAEPTQGTLVTDRVAYQLFGYSAPPTGAGKVHPPEAWDWVRGELVTAEKVSHAEVRRFVDVSREEFERRWSALPEERRHEDRVNHLRKVLATTRSYHRIALTLLEQQADLTMAYYEGTDTVGHLFARYLPPALPGVSAEEVRRFGRALPEFYAYADELLGELLARTSPETTVLLVSDHGFFTGSARPALDPSDFAMGAPQWHRLHGVVVAAGPTVRRGGIEGASIRDVAPTVLAALGLPVPRDMPGRVLPAVAGPVARDAVQTYEALPRPEPPASSAADAGAERERLRELAALGYISAEAARAGAAAPAGGGAQGMATEAYNLGRIHQQRGELERAAEQYRQALQRAPDFGEAYGALAQVHSLRGEHAQAMDILLQGLGSAAEMPPGAITGVADVAAKAGRLDEAEAALARLPDRYRASSAWHAARGMLHEQRGQAVEALRAYHAALQKNALDETALERTIGLLRRLGREKEARAVMEEAAALSERSVEALNHLALVCLRQRWSNEAERLFRRVLRSDPGNPGVMANLAAALAQQGRTAEAAGLMRQAIERDPGHAQNHYNLGAMLADQGRHREALAALEQAQAHGLRSPRLHVAMAKLHFRLGATDRAREQLQAALAIDPTDAEAKALLAELR